MNSGNFRIGNLISFKNNWRIKKIAGLDKYHVKIKSECGFEQSILYSKLRAIELTEEILLKLGFKKYNDKWFVKGLIWIDFSDGVVCFGEGFKQINLRIKCMYVHELQNLYFALTKEELTFK